jgi:hypothetical protein
VVQEFWFTMAVIFLGFLSVALVATALFWL